MSSKASGWAVSLVAVLALAAGTGALALDQAPTPDRFGGIINDYTPLIPTANPTGPWEMRGHWSLQLKRDSLKADFSAFMTMELSDYWVWNTNSDPTNPAIRSAHTHHFTMTDATVSYDTSGCPANSPGNSARFVVSGTANFITGNGNPGPFEKNGPTTLQVCITGGTDVQYSNMTLVFTGPATSHFGTQPIHGAVRFIGTSDKKDSDQH